MEKIVLENEILIEKFDLQYYLDNRKYSIAAAISALETTNEIQKSYFKHESNLDESDNILRLYALLQGLFVSIDSLYALAISLTKSKNYININHNQKLRELKYIRNDVVGHPANRVYDTSELAYCILDKHSITKNGFNYYIFTKDEKIKKEVDLNSIVKAYYIECNKYLKSIHEVALVCQNEEEILSMIKDIYDCYLFNGDYLFRLAKFKEYYINKYSDSETFHRILRRIDLIEKLHAFTTNDQDISDLIEYSIGLEIIKIIKLFTNENCEIQLNKNTPYLVSSFYRFLNKNRRMVDLAHKLYDIQNPLFNASITELMNYTKNNNIKGPYKYLCFLYDLYIDNQESLVYAFALPLKEYNKK